MPITWDIITPEFPPQIGGVADYTAVLAEHFADSGDTVRVWVGGPACTFKTVKGVEVHHVLGSFTRQELNHADAALNAFPGPKHLLLQWVPHGYGYRSLNVPFCLWIAERVRRGDQLCLVVHEPGLGLWEGNLRQFAAAVVHRIMLSILLRAASRVLITTPAWKRRIAPFAFGKSFSYEWIPVPCGITALNDALESHAIRTKLVGSGQFLIGHFSTFGAPTVGYLGMLSPELLRRHPGIRFLFIGRGGEEFRKDLCAKHPDLADRMMATGALSAESLSLHVSACDLFLQPYFGGVNGRRTSAMTILAHSIPLAVLCGGDSEELWSNNRAVISAPEQTPLELIDKMLSALASQDDLRSTGLLGRALYEEHFCIEKIGQRIRGPVESRP